MMAKLGLKQAEKETLPTGAAGGNKPRGQNPTTRGIAGLATHVVRDGDSMQASPERVRRPDPLAPHRRGQRHRRPPAPAARPASRSRWSEASRWPQRPDAEVAASRWRSPAAALEPTLDAAAAGGARRGQPDAAGHRSCCASPTRGAEAHRHTRASRSARRSKISSRAPESKRRRPAVRGADRRRRARVRPARRRCWCARLRPLPRPQPHPRRRRTRT